MSEITSALETEASRQVQASPARGETTQSEQTGESEFVAPWHPVPIRLVDEVMPRLRDTELRVLLVVLRQTWGWQADRWADSSKHNSGKHNGRHKPLHRKNYGHKRRDWLSHRQLCRRTGRGSEAVSGAVASLSASGLIVVEDAGGTPLMTPEERRRCLGRLYFRPGDMWKEERNG